MPQLNTPSKIASPPSAAAKSRGERLKDWIKANRTTVRLAFILRLMSMVVSSVMSLICTRLLLRAMGDPAYGLFMTFLGVTRLGGLGDLGITGALASRTGRAVARGEEESLHQLVAGARSLMLMFALGLSLIFLVLSPWLPQWLGFQPVPGS